MSRQFDQFITTLEKKLNLTGTEIAEILWLAQQTCTHVPVEKKPTPPQQPPTNNEFENIPPKTENKTQITPEVTSQIEQPPSDVPIVPKTSDSYPDSGLSINIPDVSSLPYPRKIAKALRFLIQYIAYGKAVLLNEKATVELMAELNGICIPILEPRRELKFDLLLVIDKSDSMIFWQRIIKELQKILKHYGIFRNIQIFGIFKDNQGKIYLKQGIGEKRYSPQKLIDPTGRRIIFIVSDCVSEIWRNGTAFNLLKIWGKHNIVAIVQMLPERMWLRTALSSGAMVQLNSSAYTVANRNLSIKEILIWDDINFHKSIKVPVFSLTQDSIKTWSKMVICKGTIGAGGFAFSPNLVQQQTQSEPQDISQISLSNEERVYQFRMSSSPLARNLASLLASAPVINLPVVRLIQKNFLPQSEKIVHVIAEVFLGGILKPTKVITPDTHPDYVEYRFIDEEIRDIFLQDSLGMTSLKIINKISEYIAEKLGKNRQEFQALLKNPQELEKLKNEKNLQNLNFNYFATITAKVLKRLGGDHALFANEIEHSLLNHNNNQAFFQEFAGNYIWAVKENGIWKEQLEGLLITRYLLISPQGEVQFGSPLDVVTIQNLSVKGQTLSWTFDDNESAASITFKINSENNYFWEQHQTGKLFEGSLQYRNKGTIDFRGRFEAVYPPPAQEFTFKVKTIILIDDSINPQTFDFQVAVIKANQSSQSDSNNILEQINEAVFNKTEKYLTNTEKQVLNGALENLTYKQIHEQIKESANYPESEQQLSNSIAKPLWKVLTEIIGEKVTKSNVKSLINKWSASSHLTIDRYSQQATGFIQDLANNTQLEMMLIPGDTFIMGSPPEELEHQEDESPQHSVTVQPFFMGKYQVTQAQWRFVAHLPQVNKELNPDPSNFKGDGSTSLTNHRPVEQVSWEDAVEFCDRLSQYTGRTYRLPSEAEWEYACRAGTTTPFHFGETITTDLVNYNGNYTYGQGSKGVYRKETTEVGSFGVANNFGLYDMHGNVWELCQDDWHSDYEGAPIDGSAWLNNEENNNGKLLRGGSWDSHPGNCRSAYRLNYYLAYNDYNVGFRVVCSGAART
jgi:formylglycine-generating enzyme required for sulfatase activity